MGRDRSEHQVFFARLEGRDVGVLHPVAARASGDALLQGASGEGSVAEALAEIAEHCLAARHEAAPGALEVLGIVGADERERVAGLLGAIARGLALIGASGWVVLQAEDGTGEALRFEKEGVAPHSARQGLRLWPEGRRGLERARALPGGDGGSATSRATEAGEPAGSTRPEE